jgi:hypothetical protein
MTKPYYIALATIILKLKMAIFMLKLRLKKFVVIFKLLQVASGRARAMQRSICQSVIQYSDPLSKTPKDI